MTITDENIPTTDVDIHKLLARRKSVAVIWSTEDVQSVRPDLDDDQAWQVLEECIDKHDCDWGFTWNFIADIADEMFPKPRAKKE